MVRVYSVRKEHLESRCLPAPYSDASMAGDAPLSASADHLLNINPLTLMLLVTNLANTKLCNNPEKLLKPWHMGTHLRVLSQSYPLSASADHLLNPLILSGQKQPDNFYETLQEIYCKFMLYSDTRQM